MDCYQIFCDLKPGVKDTDFTDALTRYLNKLAAERRIEHWRVMRRKLGLGPSHFGEFQILIEVKNLMQLDEAFRAASERGDPIESLHAGVNQLVVNFQAALYRDFPDPHRVRGQEKF